MKNQKTGTTAYNRPHQPMIHYSAKGYDEYRADLIKRLTDKGFVLKGDDFINAFIDLTAYLGEVLMTYQNAYAQEIYLETAQLRESLFSLAFMVDYRVDPGAAATGTLVVMAKPDKKGLLPKRSLVSGKDDGANDTVFFETDTDLYADAGFNELCLADTERFNNNEINTTDPNPNITVKRKMIIKPGQYINFRSDSVNLFTQVQSSAIDEAYETTAITWKGLYGLNGPPSCFDAGSGDWTLINNEARGILKIDSNNNMVWLDGRYENIASGSPIVLRYYSSVSYGYVTEISFEALSLKTGTSTRIAEAGTDDAKPQDGETNISQYIINTIYGSKTYYVIRKTWIESREVCKLKVMWISSAIPADYMPGSGTKTDPTERSPEHLVFAGIQDHLEVETRVKDTTPLNGERSLILEGDLSKLEKYRPLLLREVIDGEKTIEEVSIFEVNLDTSGTSPKSTLILRDAIRSGFTRHGLRIWGNVVKVTQGKTIANRILGSGLGEEACQALDLPQSPLTYERHGREGIKGAIDVMVSELPWEQRDDFLSSGPEDPHFVTETDFEGKSRIIFGDGLNGSRLPTGRDNIIATFRTGQGKAGNVPEKVLKRPVSKPTFLDELFNPERTGGGSDPDTEEQLRKKIPAQHLTFDRAVSLRDYADLALAYPGIGKAKAGWCWRRNKQYVVLAVAGEEGEALSASLLQDLRDYLDARRDINQPLLVREVDRVGIRLTISVTLSSGYEKERVRDAIEKALGTCMNEEGTPRFFHFERLCIGMSIHKKDIYHVVENIPGVELVTKLLLERTTTPAAPGIFIPAFCPDDIWINNWELARLDVLDLELTLPPVNKICPRIRG